MDRKISGEALEILFNGARSHNAWRKTAVSDAQLRDLYDLMKMGPTSANCSPARLVFLKSDSAKQRLKPCLDPGNVDKAMGAPVVALIGMDLEFYELLPQLFPHTDARPWFVGQAQKIHETAMRNSSLQGAYFILAARSLGLDCGPMSGYNSERLAKEFFPEGRVVPNFICALGEGDPSALFPRSPRLPFDQACQVI